MVRPRPPGGHPAQYSQGVVFGQGEADPDVEPDVQPVCFRFTVDRPPMWSADSRSCIPQRSAWNTTALWPNAPSCRWVCANLSAKGSQMLLNGKRIVFCGVNRHEWSCRTGRTVSRAEMEWDVRTTKKAHNVNAVRTSHYPTTPIFASV